jgi:serine/threonine protein kinase
MAGEPPVIKELKASDPVTVGPYKLLGRLGAGGMGQVYLAKSPGGRLVAIKLIRPELAEDRGFRERFSGEISAARGVSGIYTAAVVDADSDAEVPWMATVYVPGPSLTEAVEDNGPLPVKSVLALAAGLAEALQAIHRAGLVHRDMKPSNVLLAIDGPRVIDFGISRALERSMMTTTGMVLGSPGFMSPEQAMGEQVGQPTDVFSLGAILTYAATGAGPFGTGPATALLYRVVREEPDLSQVPESLRLLIRACLAKAPADRPLPAALLTSLSAEVEVITGEWLPETLAVAMNRYSPTLQTPLPPPFRPPDSGPLESAAGFPARSAETPRTPAPLRSATPAGEDRSGGPAGPGGDRSGGPAGPGRDWTGGPAGPGGDRSGGFGGPGGDRTGGPGGPGGDRSGGAAGPGGDRWAGVAGAGAAAGFAATELAPVSPSVRTRAGANFPDTSLAGNAGNAGAGGAAGRGTGGMPPVPPARRRRRHRSLAAVAAAVIVIAAVSTMFLLRSNSGPGKHTPQPSASLAGEVSPTSSPSPSARPTKTQARPTASATVRATSGSGRSIAPTWTPTPTRSSSPTPTATHTTTRPTSSPTATPTTSPTTKPTTSPTPTPTTSPTTSPTPTPTTSPTTTATTSPTASTTPTGPKTNPAV